MPTSLQSLVVTADHSVPIEPAGGSAVVVVDNTGGTVYYADNPQVSASQNQGSIAPGGSQTFSSNVWLRGSAPAGVSVQLQTGGPYTAWRFRKQLTIDHTKAAGIVSPFIHSVDLSSDTDVVGQANSDMSDIRFTDGDLNPLAYAAESQGGSEINTDASWCWFQDPRVIAIHGTHNRVFAAYTAGNTGSVAVAQLDLDTGVATPTSLHSAWEIDDHSAPALVALPSNKIMAFYAQHNTTTGLVTFRTSTNAEDATAWGTEQSFQASTAGQNACYPNPHLLSSENSGSGQLYVFFRDNHSQLSYATSTNYSAATPSFSATQPFITNGTTAFIYNKQIDNGVDRIDICFTDDAPDLSGTSGATRGTNNLYHVYIKGGNVFTANGTLLSSLAGLGTGLTTTSLQATSALIATTANGPAYWTWDISYDPNGNPVFVYVRFPNADWSAIEYWYARWTGSSWQLSKITVAGNSAASPNVNTAGGTVTPSYAGGIAISKTDPYTVYLSRQVAKDTTLDAFEMEKWQSVDSGLSWSRVKSITPGARRKYTRPVVPRVTGTLTSLYTPEVLFMGDAYTSYQNVSQNMLIYPPHPQISVKRAAHIQIPTVDNVTDRTILMFYGNPSATDGTSSVFEATTVGAQPWIPRSGQGGAYHHFPSLNASGWGANFTLSGFCNMPTNETDAVADFLFSNANFGTRGQGIRLWMQNGALSGDVQLTNGVIGGAFADKTGLNDGNWHHYAMTFDGTTLKAYVDGTISSTTFPATSPPKNLAGGSGIVANQLDWSPPINSSTTQRRSKGTLQDWRLDNTVRSVTWIQTRAKALTGGLVTVGSTVSRQW